jgi:hypothetical protein
MVVLAPLPAPLLEEAMDGNATRVLDVAPAVGDLEPLELDYGRNIGVYGPFSIEGPLWGRPNSLREGR